MLEQLNHNKENNNINIIVEEVSTENVSTYLSTYFGYYYLSMYILRDYLFLSHKVVLLYLGIVCR